MCFRRNEPEFTTGALHSLTHEQATSIEIDVAPTQTEDLPAPQARTDGDHEHRLESVAVE